MKVFRFVNNISGPQSPDFHSPRSRLEPHDLDKHLESGLTVRQEIQRTTSLGRQFMADRTAAGELRLTSEMVPVLSDPQKALSSTYRNGECRVLRNIILSSVYLATFEIPEDLIFKPFTYEAESELMVLSDSIWQYLVGITKNPFHLALE